MKEQERKFLLNFLPHTEERPHTIEQGYLMFEGNKHLRVRVIDGMFGFLTYKTIISDIIKTEFEYQIPYEDAKELLSTTNIKLSKLRYKTEFNGDLVDIDIYPTGERVVEIEYENELTELPTYCGREITGEKEYSNIWIAKRNSL